MFLLCLSYALSLVVDDGGQSSWVLGQSLIREKNFSAAADAFWKAILTWKTGVSFFSIEEAYKLFTQTFIVRGVPEQGPLYVAKAYLERKEIRSGIQYLHESIKIKESTEALMLLAEHDADAGETVKSQRLARAIELSSTDDDDVVEVSVRLGNTLFGVKQLKLALLSFERACQNDPTRADAFANAAYIRTNICSWGKHGRQFFTDMKRLEDIVSQELSTTMLKVGELDQQSVIHPHMTLAYTLRPELKLAVARSHARAEEVLVRKAGITPYNHSAMLAQYLREFDDPETRIKIGYVSCSLKSKALVYLTQNLFGFHDRSKFEIHAYATTPPDDPIFLEKAMRGVDWRKKMKDSVEFFHETAGLDVLQLSKLIRSHGIHILVDWDGYSHNGIRPTGLFPIQSAPIQVVHQEYIGTMGASFFQYQVSDPVASPPEMRQYHTEKLILMPHTFFVNSFAYQEPHLERPPEIIPTSKQPAVFGCGGPPASFVYCNFNKHLKFDPDTFRAWLKVLKNVDRSVLCLLEFPAESKENIVDFVESFDSDLSSRVRFLPFLANPYDNYRRVVDSCNAVLDTPIYNGHTTSMEALYGGVPVITRSDRSDMSALVGASALQTLGLTELIASDLSHYQTVAERIGKNLSFFSNVRGRLVASTSCSKARSINPLWDLRRYVRNLENGFKQVWEKWLFEGKFETVFAQDIGGREAAGVVCPSSSKDPSSRSSRKKKKEKAPRRKKLIKRRRRRRRRRRKKMKRRKGRAKRRRSEEL